MDDEARLAATLHRAVSTLEPPTARLVAGGIARGRRRRRVVRTGEVFTGAALAAGAVTLIVALVPGAARPHQGGNAAGGPSTTAPVATSDVSTTPQALLQTALDTLPRPGTTSSYEGSATDGSVSTAFTYDDGHGVAQVVVMLAYPVPGADVKKSAPIIACTQADAGCMVLRSGAHALVRQGNEYNDGRKPDAAEWGVDLVRPDGTMVSILEYNARRQKGAVISRPEPPFTTAELTAWADNAAWTKTISRQRDLATRKLFQPANPKPALSAAQASKSANAARTDVADREKAAELARQRAECAVAKAAHKALPAYCATIK